MVVAALAGAAFYTVVADLDAPTGFRQAAAFAVVAAMRLASLRWGLQTPLPDDLLRKFKAMWTLPRTPRGEMPQYGAASATGSGHRT